MIIFGAYGFTMSPLGRGGPQPTPAIRAAATAAYNRRAGHAQASSPGGERAGPPALARVALEFTSFRISVLKSDVWRLWNAKQSLGLDSYVFLREDISRKQRASKKSQEDVVKGFEAEGIKVSWRGDKLLKMDQVSGKFVIA